MQRLEDSRAVADQCRGQERVPVVDEQPREGQKHQRGQPAHDRLPPLRLPKPRDHLVRRDRAIDREPDLAHEIVDLEHVEAVEDLAELRPHLLGVLMQPLQFEVVIAPSLEFVIAVGGRADLLFRVLQEFLDSLHGVHRRGDMAGAAPPALGTSARVDDVEARLHDGVGSLDRGSRGTSDRRTRRAGCRDDSA